MKRSVRQKVAGRLRLHLTNPLLRELRRRRNAEREFQPVFIAGAMGSGTTLLAFDLGQRFEVAGVVEESALQVSRRSFLRVAPIAEHASIEAYAKSLEPRPDWPVDEARNWLQQMYRARAVLDREVVVDKGPNANLVRASFIWKCFPRAKFILIFRDPVANVEGFRRKWPLFASEPLDRSIQFYGRIHERFLSAASEHDAEVLTLSYESLVDHHEETLELVARHCGLELRSSPWSLPTRANTPGQGIRNVDREGIGLVRDANAASYRRLQPDEIRRIRQSLDPLHQRLMEASANELARWAPSLQEPHDVA